MDGCFSTANTKAKQEHTNEDNGRSMNLDRHQILVFFILSLLSWLIVWKANGQEIRANTEGITIWIPMEEVLKVSHNMRRSYLTLKFKDGSFYRMRKSLDQREVLKNSITRANNDGD